MRKQQLNLSVLSCGSIDKNWEKKPKKPVISKLIKRDIGDFAIILSEDASKPLRFLYLTLLTSKNRFEYMRALIMRMKRLQQLKIELEFEDKSLEFMQISSTADQLLRNLKILQTKMQKNKDDQLIVAKLAQQHLTVDPLLVLSLRAIASSQEFKIKKSLCCSLPFSLPSIYQILRKFSIEKDQKNQLNKFVLFHDLKQLDVQFFKSQGIQCQNQQQNCSQLFDDYLINYQECIVLQLLYSDL